jgi:ACS family glucarate transporter-like MFS transporter
VRWRICALTAIASTTALLLRTNISVSAEPMAADLGLSHLQLGLVFSGWAWGYTLFMFPGGVLGDRIGGRRAVTVMALLWGALSLAVGFVPRPGVLPLGMVIATLVALRFLLAVSQAPLFPVIGGRMVACWFPVSGWALPGALQNVGLTLGAALAGPLVAWLTEHTGWRGSFLLTAPFGFLLAPLWWWYVRDQPSAHPGVNAAERALIDERRPTELTAPTERGAWLRVLRDRQVLLIAVGYFAANFVFFFFFNWLVVYLIEARGLRLLQSGWYSSIPWIGGAAGALLGGVVCDRLWKRLGARLSCRLLGATGLALSGILLLAAARAASPVVAVVLMALCLGAEQFTDAIYWAAMISVGGRQVSAACGVMNTGGNASGVFVALLVPLLVDRLGWEPAIGAGALFAFIASALWLVTAADRQMAAIPLVEAAR